MKDPRRRERRCDLRDALDSLPGRLQPPRKERNSSLQTHQGVETFTLKEKPRTWLFNLISHSRPSRVALTAAFCRAGSVSFHKRGGRQVSLLPSPVSVRGAGGIPSERNPSRAAQNPHLVWKPGAPEGWDRNDTLSPPLVNRWSQTLTEQERGKGPRDLWEYCPIATSGGGTLKLAFLPPRSF